MDLKGVIGAHTVKVPKESFFSIRRQRLQDCFYSIINLGFDKSEEHIIKLNRD